MVLPKKVRNTKRDYFTTIAIFDVLLSFVVLTMLKLAVKYIFANLG